MQFELTFTFPKELNLPINYQSAIQGLIYHILSITPEYSAFLHDSGYHTPNSSHFYKLFVFSLLQGNYKVNFPRIIFSNSVMLEIRSASPRFNDSLCLSLLRNQDYILAGQHIHLEHVQMRNEIITSEMLKIQMISPLCLSTTYYQESKKKTFYFSPQDPRFLLYLDKNTEEKYKVAYPSASYKQIGFSPLECTEHNKTVTKFANKTYITAWTGTYTLLGDPSVLNFLYNTGLGSRNSQGFGMFNILQQL